ncbi:MAG: serine/threonine kinase [Actinomycetospora sp.]|jgi:tRNA A-37 threonylcarbamoyl transferase component Bud32|nr:serine/threonine kinase [Actinomycetospora sp.]
MSTDTGPPATVGGRYTLGDLIGRGGAADVFRARDELLGRDVAIKMFNAAGSAVADGASPGDPADPAEKIGDIEEGQEARHRREVLTLAGLSHPGLVTVYDVGDEDGRAYFVMQLIEGDTLAQRVRAGPLPVVDVVALGAALADALAYVHRRGVVHRDVKPGNVLLDAEGRAHLSDFGIAAVHDAAPVTAAGMVIGTASYLSPEQVRGEPIDGAVDIYALGLVLIECLTGRREYPGNALEAAVARLHRRPVVPPGLPLGLEALLTAMTADEAADRPTAEEVVAALRGVSREVGMDAETVLSPVLMSAPTGVLASSGPMAVGPATQARAPEFEPTGASPLAQPPVRRRRVAAVVAAVAAVLLIAGSAVAYAVLAEDTALPPPPVATLAPPPPPLPIAPQVTTTADETEVATAPRTRRSTTVRQTTTTPTTTTTTTTRRPPAVVVPPPVVEETDEDETETVSPAPAPGQQGQTVP